MLRFRPMPILTIAAIATLALLLQLGAWQWQRFEAKRNGAAPPTFVDIVIPTTPLGPPQLVYGVLEGRAGWRALYAVPNANGQATFVDAGFTPGLAPPDRTQIPAPPSLAPGASVRAIAIAPGTSPFAAKPDPVRGHWYAIDLPAMAQAAGFASAAPTLLAAPYAGTDGAPIDNPFATARDPLPPERHVGYAITWWGLAIGLVLIYAVMHVRLGRLAWERR